MNPIRNFMALAALMMPAAVQAQTAQTCVTQAEAEALVLFVAPELIRQTGQRCATVLPATALVRQTSGPFIQRYEAESARAWPLARQALGKVAGPQSGQLLDSAFAQPFIGSLVAPMIVGNLSPTDCPTVERAVSLVQTLSPRNVAGLLVLVAQADAQSARPQMRLPVCPARR